MKCTSKIADVPNVAVIEKYCCSFRNHIELQRRAVRGWILRCQVFLHSHGKGLYLSGSHHDFLRKIFVPSLAYGDLMFTWQQHDLFVPLELLQVTSVLTVNPHAGMSVGFSSARDV